MEEGGNTGGIMEVFKLGGCKDIRGRKEKLEEWRYGGRKGEVKGRGREWRKREIIRKRKKK